MRDDRPAELTVHDIFQPVDVLDYQRFIQPILVYEMVQVFLCKLGESVLIKKEE
jgi:hypothetical protein